MINFTIRRQEQLTYNPRLCSSDVKLLNPEGNLTGSEFSINDYVQVQKLTRSITRNQ